MAIFTKKIPVRESDDKNSVLKSLRETPVNDTIQAQKKKVIIKSHIRAGIIRTIAFISMCVIVFTYVFGIKTIESNDMYPQIRSGDVILYFRLSGIKRMDAVVFSSSEGDNVGRVQAAENDTVDVADSGKITINGNIQPIQKRQGLFYDTFAKDDYKTYPVTLARDEYFILGDQRESARDSRVYGPVDKKQIRGKIFMILRRRQI